MGQALCPRPTAARQSRPSKSRVKRGTTDLDVDANTNMPPGARNEPRVHPDVALLLRASPGGELRIVCSSSPSILAGLSPSVETPATRQIGCGVAPDGGGPTWLRSRDDHNLRQAGKNGVVATRVFISFDFDHDEDLRNMLAGQAKNPGSPFEIANWSVKEAFTGDWKAKVRERIMRIDQVAVICGNHIHRATGVSAEIQIARDEGKPYFLLAGRTSGANQKPAAALATDKIYNGHGTTSGP